MSMRFSDATTIVSRIADLHVLFEEFPSGVINIGIVFDEFLNY
jgi:hypothetical protein